MLVVVVVVVVVAGQGRARQDKAGQGFSGLK